MNRIEAFLVLGIDVTKEERTIKNAYRGKLAVTNPEDDPEGFKRLRGAYEEALKYAKETETDQEEKERDTTPSGLWLERAVEIYGNIRTRQDMELWKELFEDDVFFSIEEEENCRLKLLGFLTDHYKLPTGVWKLLDQKLFITRDAKALREKFPPNFMHYIVGRCERGEDLEFSQFEGPEDADYDLFLEYYDRCWQALGENNLEEAENCVRNADKLGIRHPVMEISRANILMRREQGEAAVRLLEEQRNKYPGDAMICYNFAEMLWKQGGDYKGRAAELYEELKNGNDFHYMANMRLTEWYFDRKRFREAKKCAEKVIASGSDEAFLNLLVDINREIEKDLEARCKDPADWEAGLELSWCYLQDGKTARGIRLASGLESLLPPKKEMEYKGLLAKLYVEQGEYEDSIAMTRVWEALLEERLAKGYDGDEKKEKKDRDRLRQVHLIRMQCYHNLGFREKENFALAVKEGETVLTGGGKDIGVLMEMAQIYLEMEEYDKCQEIVQKLVDDYQIFAAYASSMESYRRQLNAGGVVRTAGLCIRYFPNYPKAYEYLAKVYLDLDRREDLEKVLEDAEKNGVKSPILEAYAYQKDHKARDLTTLNGELKTFREEYMRPVEKGEQGFYEKGLPILTEYLYNYPDDFMLVERGIFHRAAHHLKEAKEDFEKALYVNPSNPYALNGLSFIYKYEGEYEKALFFIKKAILYLDEEMSAVIYADMGNLYALLGIEEMALAAYKQYECLAGEVRGRWFGDNLAEFYMRAGKIEEAAAVYGKYYWQDKWSRYEKLVSLYRMVGHGEMARRVLRQWRAEMRAGSVRNVLKGILPHGTDGKEKPASRTEYYCSMGWLELLWGSQKAAMKAFEKMFRSGLAEDAMEGKICDAVFACIICGDEKRGIKYAWKLQDWLQSEKNHGKTKYYNRQKGYLQIEFLAEYYRGTAEKLQEILDREKQCEICHFCTSPLCRELEAARVLLLLRQGKKKEAGMKVRHHLEIQPWDEFMLAVRHTVFGDVLS